MNDVVIAAIFSGIVGVIGGVGGAYVLIYRARSEGRLKEQELQAKQQEKAQAAEDRRRKAESSEYKQLYLELKAEVLQVKGQDRKCQRRCRRLELALARAGIDIPDLDDDDEGDDEHARTDSPGSSQQ